MYSLMNYGNAGVDLTSEKGREFTSKKISQFQIKDHSSLQQFLQLICASLQLEGESFAKGSPLPPEFYEQIQACTHLRTNEDEFNIKYSPLLIFTQLRIISENIAAYSTLNAIDQAFGRWVVRSVPLSQPRDEKFKWWMSTVNRDGVVGEGKKISRKEIISYYIYDTSSPIYQNPAAEKKVNQAVQKALIPSYILGGLSVVGVVMLITKIGKRYV